MHFTQFPLNYIDKNKNHNKSLFIVKLQTDWMHSEAFSFSVLFYYLWENKPSIVFIRFKLKFYLFVWKIIVVPIPTVSSTLVCNVNDNDNDIQLSFYKSQFFTFCLVWYLIQRTYSFFHGIKFQRSLKLFYIFNDFFQETINKQIGIFFKFIK